MAAEIKHGYCALCTSSCGVTYTVDNDRITSVRNNPAHPTGQSMCLKGKSAPELVDSAERLKYPLKRTNPKGSTDPGWQRISWDEALDTVAAKLSAIRRETGAQSVAFGITTPSGTPMADSAPWVERFVFQFGSPNISYASELCNWHKEAAHAFTFGRGMPTPDYINSDLIILWGHNPANTYLSQAHAIGEARKAGAKLIVIDPNETALAREADVWLQVRPGADGALAMGLANQLIANGRYDESFIARWSNAGLLVREDNGLLLRGSDLGLQPADALACWDGTNGRVMLVEPRQAGTARPVPACAKLRGRFDVTDANGQTLICHTAFELYARACATFSLERTCVIGWMDLDRFQAALDLIANSRRITLHSWTGVEQHSNATQTMRAMTCLYALTGSYDKVGGNRVFGALPYRAVNDISQLPASQLALALGRQERPIGPPASGWISTRSLYRAILDGEPYKVRAYMSFGANPLLSQADTSMAAAAFRALEFHVHCDLYMTPTAENADIVLPVNSLWEREALRIGFDISPLAAEWVQLRSQMVTARGEGRSDADIVFDLAVRLGMGDQFFGGSLEQGWSAMLEPLNLTTDFLRKHPEGVRVQLSHPTTKYTGEGFGTPTGLVELYSETMHLHGAGALPEHDENSIVQPSKSFPFILTNAKSGYYCHSQQRNLASLRRKARAPTLQISPVLAGEKGIGDGDWVEVRTRNGSARFRAKLEGKLHPKVAIGDYGWWQACTPLGQPALPYSGADTSNFNSLIDADHADPVSGSVPMRSTVCDIRRDARSGRQPARWTGFRDFRVARIVEEAPGVKRVHLKPAEGGRLPPFEAGQHITLRLALGAGEGKDETITRSYSLIGRANTHSCTEYVICVRNAAPHGADMPDTPSASWFIDHRLRVGDRIGVQMPYGNFIIPTLSTRPVVLYAGGIGITPFISTLRAAAARSSKTPFLLLYANRNSGSHLFRDELARLASRLPNLRIVNYYSRPLAQDREGRDFDLSGHVSIADIPPALLETRALHYLCGSNAMMQALIGQLLAAGVPPFDIMKERFTSPIAHRPTGNETYQVKFARAGKTLAWSSGNGSLLSFAESCGVTISSGCRVGQCENCSVRVVSGDVTHLHDGAPDEDGMCITCQAVPASDIVLDA